MQRHQTMRSKAPGLPDFLHYAGCVAPGIMLGKDGSLSASFLVVGEDRSTISDETYDDLSARLNARLLWLTNGWTLNIDVLRRPVAGYPEDHAWPHPILRLIDAEQRARYLAEGAHHVTDTILTITWLPPTEREKSILAALVTAAPSGETRQALDENIAEFTRRVDDFANHLSGMYRIRPLIPYDGGAAVYDEQLAFLNTCLTGTYQPIALPPIPFFIDTVLGGHDFVGGHYPQIGNRLVRVIAIEGQPTHSYSGILRGLELADQPLRWSTRFIALDRNQAMSATKRVMLKWAQRVRPMMDQLTNRPTTNPDEHALDMVADVKAAQKDIESQNVRYGYQTSVVVLHEEIEPGVSPEEIQTVRLRAARRLLERSRALEKIIADAGYVSRVESLNAVEAFLGSLPGASMYNIRRPLVHTANLADQIPVTSLDPGPDYHPHPDYPAGSPPHYFAEAEGGTPVRLSLCYQDVGHTFLAGPTGAGKSTKLAFIVAQHLRYPGAQAFVLDVDRSLYALAAGANGALIDYGDPGAPRLCPLARLESDDDLAWTADFIEMLCSLQDVKLSIEQRNALTAALVSFRNSPPDARSLTEFSAQIQDPAIQRVLAAYRDSVVDGSCEPPLRRSSGAPILYIELAQLMRRQRELPAVLFSLFRQLENYLDGKSPTILACDEAWMALKDEIFAGLVESALRRFRKKLCSVIFATQSITDVLNHKLRSVILDSCPVRLLLPNRNATMADVAPLYSLLGLADHEIYALAQAEPKQDYLFVSPTIRRLYRLRLGSAALAWCGISKPDDVAALRACMDGGGNWQSRWLAIRGASEWLPLLETYSS